ncbi:MAG: YadA-like family protein [Alphaproteobacteria bacterium]|nr:YadA-like family protein [Alphaproteobacteria bacterium]
MIKQSKTTIKELTAQYRAVLKHAFFAGIAAVAVSTTGAMAEINVATGETDITSGVISAINTSINNNAPDKADFSYKAPDGTTIVKLSDDTQYVADDYKTDSTSKDNTYGITGPDSVNWESNLTAANYTYTPLTADGTAGTPVTGDTAVNHLTKTVVTSALHSLYSGASLALSSDSTATETLNTLDYSTTSGGNSYYLYKTAEGEFKLVTSTTDPAAHIVEDPSAIGVSGVLTDLTNAYNGDDQKVKGIQKTLTDSYNTNKASFDYINNETTGYLAKDKKNAAGLLAGKNSLDTANDGFSTAQTNYNGSVGQAIDSHILNEDGAVAKAVTNLIDTKEALLSQDIGYDLGNPDDAENGLVARLDALTGAEGEDTSLVGAINANTEAIAQVRSDAEDAWERGEAWIGQELGYDTTTTDANTVLSGAGFTPDAETGKASVVSALIENKTAIANVDGQVGDVKGAAVGLQLNEYGVSQNLVEGGNAAVQFQQIARVIGDRTTLNGDYVSNTDVAANLQSLNDGIEENADAIAAEKTRAQGAEATLQNNIDAEATARANADLALQAEINDAVYAAKAGDALTLKSANDYTDAQVDTLEKNISGGVAAATALSAVEVSNVKKGEMSVGGGYGYYNGESAGAFGMAMGLSDNWSVNAGAGVASGDKTQVSFRAGTNYKFKLF